MNTTKEELDEEEDATDEEEEAMFELRDSFEENMSPEHQAAVERLVQLGYDRAFVTPILFICHGD
jgi:hypothetical protein